MSIDKLPKKVEETKEAGGKTFIDESFQNWFQYKKVNFIGNIIFTILSLI